MRNLFTLLLLLFFSLTMKAQTGSVRLGSQITNGISTDGCAASCVTNVAQSDPSFICNPSGNNNHTVQTMTHTLTVPAGNYMALTVVTNACNAGTDGLDSGDNFYVNGALIVEGSNNTRVNYSGCFVNNNTSDLTIPISFTANRRDETVTATWTISTTNPGGACTNALPLPIKLNKFSASAYGETVYLDFSTASEINNDYFSIERSKDGKSFELIGELEGAGNSTKALSYNFIDREPLPGLNFYRIKQTDFDGRYSYSDVRSVRSIASHSFAISPSTSSDYITIATDVKEYDVSIYNVQGQMVLNYAALQGTQTISIDRLKSGMYVIDLNTGFTSETIKFVKH